MKKNYKAYIPIGITFLASGIIFISTVNKAVGIGLLGVGMMWIVIGLKKRRESR
ncbi:MAG: hypothetical protein JJE18_11010 [Eubacteriaceae bacterium]|nr:hypothetical protein [Eubacteriaceae bacterium]